MKNLVSWLGSQQWLIEETALERLSQVINLRENDRGLYEKLKADAAEAITHKQSKKDKAKLKPFEFQNDDAFIDAHGVLHYAIAGELTPKTGGLDTLSGLQSYSAIRDDLSMALANPSVKGFLLDYDSPGGTVAGIYETNDLISQIRQTKPVVSFVSQDMYSAAYWLGSNADKLFATQSAGIGSIGVLSVHLDQSKKLEKAGVKPTVMRAGRFKAKGNALEPLDEQTINDKQSQLNQIYMQFLSTVAVNRNLSLESMDDWAEGRTFDAKGALKLGLIDAIGTYDDAYDHLLSLVDRGDDPLNQRDININHIAQSPKKMSEENNNQEYAAEIEELKLQVKEQAAQIANYQKDIEAKEAAEKETLIAQIGAKRAVSPSEKSIFARCSLDELKAVLAESAEEPEEKEKEKEKEPVAAKHVFVGAVNASTQADAGPKLSDSSGFKDGFNS